jgi:hypothetical protein
VIQGIGEPSTRSVRAATSSGFASMRGLPLQSSVMLTCQIEFCTLVAELAPSEVKCGQMGLKTSVISTSTLMQLHKCARYALVSDGLSTCRF